MPDKGDPHLRTWMAFGASQKIWGKKLLPEVQIGKLSRLTLMALRREVEAFIAPHSKNQKFNQVNQTMLDKNTKQSIEISGDVDSSVFTIGNNNQVTVTIPSPKVGKKEQLE